MRDWEKLTPGQRLVVALGISALVSVGLYFFRLIYTGSVRYWFLVWNLALAWVPLFFAWGLAKTLKSHRWMSVQGMGLTLLWLVFLPNSFYLVSDLVHLHPTGEISVLYDAVMFGLFIFNGFIYGFASLLVVHRELLRRVRPANAHSTVALVLLICSFAIYLGRYLRWNTWDVLVNPAGLLIDVSDRFVNPAAHEQTYSTTAVMFLLLGTLYWVIWETVRFLRSPKLK
jgi:uncharacterized membrane protein